MMTENQTALSMKEAFWYKFVIPSPFIPLSSTLEHLKVIKKKKKELTNPISLFMDWEMIHDGYYLLLDSQEYQENFDFEKTSQ